MSENKVLSSEDGMVRLNFTLHTLDLRKQHINITLSIHKSSPIVDLCKVVEKLPCVADVNPPVKWNRIYVRSCSKGIPSTGYRKQNVSELLGKVVHLFASSDECGKRQVYALVAQKSFMQERWTGQPFLLALSGKMNHFELCLSIFKKMSDGFDIENLSRFVELIVAKRMESTDSLPEDHGWGEDIIEGIPNRNLLVAADFIFSVSVIDKDGCETDCQVVKWNSAQPAFLELDSGMYVKILLTYEAHFAKVFSEDILECNTSFSSIKPSNYEFVLHSPFPNTIHLFNEESSYPDLSFAIPGSEEPLKLHRCLLLVSEALSALFRCKSSAHGQYDPEARSIVWVNHSGENREEYNSALTEWLQFCYGKDIHFSINDVVDVLTVMHELELKGKEDLWKAFKAQLEFMASQDPVAGAELLCECVKQKELVFEDVSLLLAKKVLTYGVFRCHDMIVTKCLMNLPPTFLDVAAYGPANTRYGEFNLRMMYIEFNSDKLSDSECHDIMMKSDVSCLGCRQLKQMEDLGLFTPQELLEMYKIAFSNSELLLFGRFK